MRIIDTRRDGATIEFSQLELSLLGLIGSELFGGSFSVSDDEWQSVMMPVPREEAKELLLRFGELYAANKRI